MSREMRTILITWEADKNGRRVGGKFRQEGYDVADGQRRFGLAFRHSRIVSAVDAGPAVTVTVPAPAGTGPAVAGTGAGARAQGSPVPTVLVPRDQMQWPQPCRNGCGTVLEKMDAITSVPQGRGRPPRPGPFCYECMLKLSCGGTPSAENGEIT